jgi:hypothetical protein
MAFMKWNSKSDDKKPDAGATRIVLPDSPELLMQLADKIMSMHATAGGQSPITPSIVSELGTQAKAARQKHEDGMRYLQMANNAFAERDQLLGTRQDIRSDVTPLKFYVNCVGDILARDPAGNPAAWGFTQKK